MNFKILIRLSLFCCAVLLAACTRHRGDVEEQVPTASITFASPVANAVYKTGDSVQIQCTAMATAEMHGCDVSIRNAADTSIIYYYEHVHEHNAMLTIDKKWKDTLTTAANLQVAVTAILDHDGHTSTQTVTIKNEVE